MCDDFAQTNVICKCLLDCSLGVDADVCRMSAHWNLVKVGGGETRRTRLERSERVKAQSRKMKRAWR